MNFTPIRDAALRRALRRGDANAIVAALEPACRAIVAEFFVVDGTRDDLLQEARMGALKAARDFRPERGSFHGFASLCIRRQVVTAVVTSRRGKHLLLSGAVSVDVEYDEGLTLAETIPMHGSDPADIAVAREELGSVVAMMMPDGGLTDLERVAARFVLIAGGSYETVAAEHGISVKQLDNALQRARLKLTARMAA